MVDWSLETEKDPFWAPFIEKFRYAMQAMFNQIRYYKYKTNPPVENRTDEQVHEYLRNVEYERRNLLKERMNVYTVSWYPERILEFDEWASQQGLPKGRGPHGRRSFDEFCKHLLQQESDVRQMITISVKLLSGELFQVTYNKAQCFPGLERALYEQYGKQFPLNHVEVLTERKYWTYTIQSGDELPIFVHPIEFRHHSIHRRPDGRIDIEFYPYFCCRSKKMIPYPHGHFDRGRVSESDPGQSHTQVYYQHHGSIQSYPIGRPSYEISLQWKSIEDLLKWINTVSTWTFTPEAFDHMTSFPF